MTSIKLEIQSRIKDLREELENRHKYGTIKMAKNGVPISVDDLQKELYSLIYRLSKME